ncbi:MAG: hypothetical protein Q8807_03735, partial ['Waltheria sp.' little leaf phytoplasma]|nr:hypothetical protein ['Waltheria sp.' little leaf phytoplasma]
MQVFRILPSLPLLSIGVEVPVRIEDRTIKKGDQIMEAQKQTIEDRDRTIEAQKQNIEDRDRT